MSNDFLQKLPPHFRSYEFGFCCGLFGLLLLTYWLYAPGVNGPLLLDDFWNLRRLGENGGIVNLDNLRQYLFGNSSGPSGRPVSMLAFLIDAQDWPPLVHLLKVTNILLHLLCGAMLFWFCILLARLIGLSQLAGLQFAIMATAVWLMHPFNVSTVLYVVQRMTQLMTLFTLSALCCYLAGRLQLDSNPRRAAWLLCACLFPFGLLAVLSKENGALLLFVILLMEWIFFRRNNSTFFRLWLLGGVVVPSIIVVLYLVFGSQESMALYEIRHYTMGERLLTEARVILNYMVNI